jgi:group II intron reverse transcriptase/maturase
METKLARIAEVARTRPKEKFTSLAHIIDKEMLCKCHKEMKIGKASGVDEVTKTDYDQRLEGNLDDLLTRMKKQAYKPLPARRTYIPKPGTDAKRPLGIPAYEDKLVQAALAKILNAIYEEIFLECSYGYRPGRSCHDAIKMLRNIVNKPRIRFVVETDIKAFFDKVDHTWMIKFLEHKIQDKNILRLIHRLLKAGIIEAGIKYDTPQGTPQGGVCSPILANIYLHYVQDLWFEKGFKKNCNGEAYMVRYADDSVFFFEDGEDATSFYKALIERLAKFGLEVAEDKTRIIELHKDGKDDDDSDPFDFLGFTFYQDKNPNRFGRKEIKLKTSKKKMQASLLRSKEWMRNNRTLMTKEFMKKVKSKVQGHINYFAVTGNRRSVGNFIDEVRKLLFKWLNRRSQKNSFNWEKFILFMEKYPLPKVQTKVYIYELGAGANYLK